MKTREEIMKDWKNTNAYGARSFGAIDDDLAVMLEVLLDIRDLLIEQRKNKEEQK